jgi:hypothetical protein
MINTFAGFISFSRSFFLNVWVGHWPLRPTHEKAGPKQLDTLEGGYLERQTPRLANTASCPKFKNVQF